MTIGEVVISRYANTGRCACVHQTVQPGFRRIRARGLRKAEMSSYLLGRALTVIAEGTDEPSESSCIATIPIQSA
jgi:hypothetical protein